MRLPTVNRLVLLACAFTLVGPWLSGFALAGSASADSGSADAGPAIPNDPLEGRWLFESRNCVQCHGIAGGSLEVGAGVGPDLGHTAFGGSFLDLGAALWNHVPGMSVRQSIAATICSRVAPASRQPETSIVTHSA